MGDTSFCIGFRLIIKRTDVWALRFKRSKKRSKFLYLNINEYHKAGCSAECLEILDFCDPRFRT